MFVAPVFFMKETDPGLFERLICLFLLKKVIFPCFLFHRRKCTIFCLALCALRICWMIWDIFPYEATSFAIRLKSLKIFCVNQKFDRQIKNC